MHCPLQKPKLAWILWGFGMIGAVDHSFADAPVINIDFGPSPGTHGAAMQPGPLGGGSLWNLAAGSKANLDDSNGNPTTVDVVVTAGTADERFAAASNKLQDDSLTDASEVAFVIGGLDPTKTYSIAIFGHSTTAIRATISGDAAIAILAGIDWQSKLTPDLDEMEEDIDFKVAGGFAPKAGSNTIDVTITREGSPGTCYIAGLQIAEEFSRADGLIGSRLNRLAGNDRYLRRGAGPQKIRRLLNAPRTVRHFLEVQNDGLLVENFAVRQEASSRVNRREFRIRYFQLNPGRTNITSRIRRGTFTPVLGPREAGAIRILQKIKPLRRALSTKPRIKAKIDIECDPQDNDDIGDEDNLRSIIIVKRR